MLVWIVDGYTEVRRDTAGRRALADRFGAENTYLLGLAIFVAAWLLCGAAATARAGRGILHAEFAEPTHAHL